MSLFLKTIGGASLTPQTIYGIGRNYAEHATELRHEIPKEPIVFLKHLASLRELNQGPLAYPEETFHHEAEVVLILGKSLPMGRQASWDDILALGLGLDLTRREAQQTLKTKGLPWTLAKAFAGAAPVSPFVPKSAFPSLNSITFSLHIEGTLRQSGNTQDMLFSPLAIMNYLLSFTPLYEGDLIFTGTPPGVGPIKRGEAFTLTFEDIGQSFSGRL